MYQNLTGQELDYETFKVQFDKEPDIKTLVKSFNKYGVVINTAEKEMPTEFGQPPKDNKSDAMRAANKVLKQPG